MPASTNNHRLITLQNPRSPISEAYRALRTNIQFSSADEPIRTVLVTSAQPAEGKSTTVANLAVAYAQEGKRVLVIDADLRKPTQHLYFMLSNRTGLTNVLANQHHLLSAIAETHIDHLSLLPSGPIPPNPSELLASRRMSQTLEEVKERFDIVLIDSPPTLAVTDSQILAAQSDGVVAVLSAGKVKREQARKMMASLEHVKARVLGVVLNNKRGRSDKSDYYYYAYYGHKEE